MPESAGGGRSALASHPKPSFPPQPRTCSDHPCAQTARAWRWDDSQGRWRRVCLHHYFDLED